MSTFYSLPQLKSLITARRQDLGRLRSIAAEAETKIAALQGQGSRYSQSFIVAESAKIRQSAMEWATAVMRSNQTFEHFQMVAEQKSAWATPAYLARAAGEESTEKTLLKLISLQLSLQYLTVETMEQLFDVHASAGNWSAVGTLYNAMAFRGAAGDENAAAAHLRLTAYTPPQCEEALDLIAQSEQLKEYVNYSLNSIGTGAQDMGLRMEQYAQMGRERDEAATRSQADAELERQSAVTQWQLRN